MKWVVEVPLVGNVPELWFQVCVVCTPEAVAEVCRVLASHPSPERDTFRVRQLPEGS